jgi:glucoamylase
LLPEQVWDAPDIVPLELFNGRPAGSAMPLVWAHAEYVKLLRSLRESRVFDRPPQTHGRYVVNRNTPRVASWRFTMQRRQIPPGRILRLDVEVPARVRWTSNDWTSWMDTPSREVIRGAHIVELPSAGLPSGTVIRFTFYWVDAARWEGEDFSIVISNPVPADAPR